MTQIQLWPARPSEAAAISDVAMRSKAHREYHDEFLLVCRPDLTIAPEQCDGIRIIVAKRSETILGIYRPSGKPPAGTLEALFVNEPIIGCGLGRLLFDDAVARARRLGLTTLQIDADPDPSPRQSATSSTWKPSSSSREAA